MNTKTIGAIALTGALAIVGCVSVDSLQTQINSGDAAQVADAKSKITEIVTTGMCGSELLSYKQLEREQCASLVTDSKHAIEIIEKMSHPEFLGNRNTAQEIVDANRGVIDCSNAGSFRILLGKVDKNNQEDLAQVMSILLRGDERYCKEIENEAKAFSVQAIGCMNDRNVLLKMQQQCSNFRNYKYYELLIALDDNKAIVNRLLALAKTQQDLADLIKSDLVQGTYGCGIKDAAVVKLTDMGIILELSQYANVDDKFRMKLFNQISDENELAKFVLGIENAMWDSDTTRGGKVMLEKIKSPANLLQIALFAKNETLKVVAKEKISDPKVFIAEVEKLLKEYKNDEWRALAVVAIIADEAATVGMYDGATSQAVKQCIFKKLKSSDRVTIRARNKAACESKIAAAKGKEKETFELGGFYLGMDIAEVDALVGYYFPEEVNEECFGVDGFGDDDKNVRALRIPQQGVLFCRANKDGKVFEFNFGKNFLKKFYKFDVQNYREWASAYAKQSGLDLKFKYVSKEFSISNAANNFFGGGGGVSEYKALYTQETYTYKHNSKEFRVTYYGESDVAAGNSTVKSMARGLARYGVGGEMGSLRVKVDKD